MGLAVVDTGGHKAKLVADVIPGAFEALYEDALRLVQGIDGIDQLHLTACSRSLILKNLEDSSSILYSVAILIQHFSFSYYILYWLLNIKCNKCC